MLCLFFITGAEDLTQVLMLVGQLLYLSVVASLTQSNNINIGGFYARINQRIIMCPYLLKIQHLYKKVKALGYI